MRMVKHISSLIRSKTTMSFSSTLNRCSASGRYSSRSGEDRACRHTRSEICSSAIRTQWFVFQRRKQRKRIEWCLEEKPQSGANFAGMKKGFLGGGSTAKPKSKELIEVKRQPTASASKDFRVFDEVQQVISDEQKAKSKTFLGRRRMTDQS